MQFILRHERQQVLRFAALESDAGRQVRTRHPEIDGADSMIWVERPGAENESVLIRSAAGLRVAAYLGGWWRVALLGRFVPRPIRDAAYDFIARHRHRLVREAAECYVPPAAVRSRFLDRPT